MNIKWVKTEDRNGYSVWHTQNHPFLCGVEIREWQRPKGSSFSYNHYTLASKQDADLETIWVHSCNLNPFPTFEAAKADLLQTLETKFKLFHTETETDESRR